MPRGDGSLSRSLRRGRLDAGCAGLAGSPLVGKKGAIEGTRERLMTRAPYGLVYRIDEDIIFVARIVHIRRQWPPEE